jgi:predicted aconitase
VTCAATVPATVFLVLTADEGAPMTTADRDRLRELAATEASLRRIAMLVANGAAPETVFDAVTNEALRRFGSGTARMIRYELDGTATILANEGASRPHVTVVKCGRTIRQPV